MEAAHGGRNEARCSGSDHDLDEPPDALLPQSFAKAGLVAYFRGLLRTSAGIGVLALADDALLSRNLPRIQEFARERSVRNDLEDPDAGLRDPGSP